VTTTAKRRGIHRKTERIEGSWIRHPALSGGKSPICRKVMIVGLTKEDHARRWQVSQSQTVSIYLRTREYFHLAAFGVSHSVAAELLSIAIDLEV
jgi:hypothetical protein